MEAESALDNREELLFQSAIRLERNLHLLGNYALQRAGAAEPGGVCSILDGEVPWLQSVAALHTLGLMKDPSDLMLARPPDRAVLD